MREASKHNDLDAARMNEKEYLDTPEEALADAENDVERLYRKELEVFTAQENVLRSLGIEGLRFPSALHFWTDSAMMSNFLERSKDEDAAGLSSRLRKQ